MAEASPQDVLKPEPARGEGASAWPDAPGSEEDGLSPYRSFTRDDWAKLRADTPLTLTVEEVMRLQSLNDPISLTR
jgi:type I pantothenate kinase